MIFTTRIGAAALFGAKVRKRREVNGWTQEQLGEKVFCTGDMISKVELWHLVNKETLPEWFRPYPEIEAEATSIRTFGLALIDGLLQTEAYAREIFRTGQTPEKLDQLLATRMKRQEILARSAPTRLWVVLRMPRDRSAGS
jgi:transcriptional regulator with XRE-family HTH domain